MKSSEEFGKNLYCLLIMMQRAYARRTIFDIFHPGNSSVSPNPNFAVAKSLSFAVAISYSFLEMYLPSNSSPLLCVSHIFLDESSNAMNASSSNGLVKSNRCSI